MIKLILKFLGQVLSILKINAESIYDWYIKRKNKKMAKKVITTDPNTPQPQLNANTQIVFTIKSFFALISTLLGLFYGFYQLVVVPKVNTTEAHYETMFKDQKEQNKVFYDKLGDINTAIGSLNSSVESLNKNSNQQRVANSGGVIGITTPDTTRHTTPNVTAVNGNGH